MRKSVISLLLVACCVSLVFAQSKENKVIVMRAIKQENAKINALNWNGGTYLFHRDSVCYMTFKKLRKKAASPLMGTMTKREGKFFIKDARERGIFAVTCYAKGLVLSADGDSIVVSHENSFESHYANLKTINVKKGDVVKKKQLLGILSDDKLLSFDLRFEGVSLDLMEIFDPKTSLMTYADDLYFYGYRSPLFVSRISPCVLQSLDKKALRECFMDTYSKNIADHRAKRKNVDTSLFDAIQEEISLEDVQIGPAAKQDTIRVQNIIDL